MTQPQEVLRNYQQLLSNNNTVNQPSFSSMILNGIEVRGGNNLVTKQTRYIRRSVNKVRKIADRFNIIYLFKYSNNFFYVGGDRFDPELVYEVPTMDVDKTVSFLYGSIQKTGVFKNAFIVNLFFILDPPVEREQDMTEPVTYWLYSIKSADDEGETELEALKDSDLINGIYASQNLTVSKQILILPRYPQRSVPVLQNDEATLDDRGYYFGFGNNTDPYARIGYRDFAFQYGYFGGFEVGMGTISERRSGEWHDIGIGEDELPPKGSVRPSDNLDSLPQFNPDALQYQTYPFDTEYDYTQVKYAYEPPEDPEDPYEPPFTGGQGVGIVYRVAIAYNGFKNAGGEVNPSIPTTVYGHTEGALATADTPPSDDWIRVYGIRVWGNVESIVQGTYYVSGSFGYSTHTITARNHAGATTSFNFQSPYNAREVTSYGGFAQYQVNGTTARIYKIVREDGLPDNDGDPPNPNPNQGCSDVDANNYVELQDPEKEDLRTTQTCRYNPFKIRGNQRTTTVLFEPITDPDTSETVLPDPSILPTQQNLSIANPIRKLVDNSKSEILSINNYSVQTATIPTTQKITVQYNPPDPFALPYEPQWLGVSGEFLETKFLGVRYDKQAFLNKKTNKYGQEISEEIGDILEADPDSEITKDDLVNQYSAVTGFANDIPYLEFKLPEDFFGGSSENNGKNIFDFYSPNYALDDTIFVVTEKEGLSDGDVVEIIKTRVVEAEDLVSVVHEPLSGSFLGEIVGVIVDASAYFEED